MLHILYVVMCVCVCARACLCVFICVYVCVCERERERERVCTFVYSARATSVSAYMAAEPRWVLRPVVFQWKQCVLSRKWLVQVC